MPGPAIVTRHGLLLSEPLKIPAVVWLFVIVTVNVTVFVPAPMALVAPPPTQKTAASPSVQPISWAGKNPWSAAGPAEPSAFLAQPLVSQKPLRGVAPV